MRTYQWNLISSIPVAVVENESSNLSVRTKNEMTKALSYKCLRIIKIHTDLVTVVSFLTIPEVSAYSDTVELAKG